MLITVPAHEEAAEIGACLEHVAAAVHLALEAPDPPRVHVRVGAHRSTDATFEIALRTLGGLPVPFAVASDRISRSVGEVRHRLVEEGSRPLDDDPARTWVLSTDADSWVPASWIVDLLDLAATTGAVAVAGMVALRGWDPSPRLRERYASLIEAKLGVDGHEHVYGANLAVRLDAYRRVGGFRSVVGEDQDLVDRLRASGEPVVGAFAPVVPHLRARTGTRPGRAGRAAAAAPRGGKTGRRDRPAAAPEAGDGPGAAQRAAGRPETGTARDPVAPTAPVPGGHCVSARRAEAPGSAPCVPHHRAGTPAETPRIRSTCGARATSAGFTPGAETACARKGRMDSDHLEVIQNVVDRVSSYQDGAPEGTVEKELRTGLDEAGVELSDDQISALTSAVEAHAGEVEVGSVLG